MKKLFCLLLALALFTLMGCRSGDVPTVTPPATTAPTADTTIVYDRPVAYKAHYIRTDGYHDGVKYPKAAVIHDRNSLDVYYNANKDLYSLGRNPNPGSDYTKGFLDICDSYDDGFFAENYLVLILLEEGSGSIRHSIEEVVGSSLGGTLHIGILREIPEIGTADMAQWHILLEISREYPVEAAQDVQVYLDGVLAWDGETVQPMPPDSPYTQPPQGLVITPDGETPMHLGGYAWFYRKNGQMTEASLADVAYGPLPESVLKPVTIDPKHAESIYLPVPGTDIYAPTNSLGYSIKLHWQQPPSRITCDYWPDTWWKDSSIPAVSLPIDPDAPLYARDGGYIYAFTAIWDDTGSGFYGTATYYTYILPASPA